MARPLRIEFPSAFYHVISRGNERKAIFKSDSDREKFLQYLKLATGRYRAVIYAYCLLDNHYHLLVETPEGNLSKVMRFINGSYATYFNVKRNRAGHLLQGRYKAILVEKDTYALALSRYIHLNPVKAGIVKRPEEYRWASYCAYIEKSNKDWIDTGFLLRQFSGDLAKSRRRFMKFTHEGIKKELEDPAAQSFAGMILGREEFVKQVRSIVNGKRVRQRDFPAFKALKMRPTLEEIEERVGREITTIKKERRKIGIYLSHHYSGNSLREIAEWYGGIGESGISQVVKRFSLDRTKNKVLDMKIARVEKQLDNWKGDLRP